MADDLKQSDAGYVGGTNGSLGGASMDDLKQGYIPEQPAVPAGEWDMPLLYSPLRIGGFVGRPRGNER